jgi:hypothetical protein
MTGAVQPAHDLQNIGGQGLSGQHQAPRVTRLLSTAAVLYCSLHLKLATPGSHHWIIYAADRLARDFPYFRVIAAACDVCTALAKESLKEQFLDLYASV